MHICAMLGNAKKWKCISALAHSDALAIGSHCIQHLLLASCNSLDGLMCRWGSRMCRSMCDLERYILLWVSAEDKGFTAQITGQPASGLLLSNLPASPWLHGSNYSVPAHRWEGHVIWDCSFSLLPAPEQPWTHSPLTHQKWKALRWGWIFAVVGEQMQTDLFINGKPWFDLVKQLVNHFLSHFSILQTSCVAFIGCKHFCCQVSAQS